MNVDQRAVAAFPELAHVVALREAGWRFNPVHLDDGQLAQIDGFRTWPDGWTDAIRLRSPCDVLGIRVAPGEPPGIVWERSGDVAEIVHALLTLPSPGDRLAPRLVTGRAAGLWTP